MTKEKRAGNSRQVQGALNSVKRRHYSQLRGMWGKTLSEKGDEHLRKQRIEILIDTKGVGVNF
jgi:hypothetical protein